MQKRWDYRDYSSKAWILAGLVFLLLAIGGVWIASSRNSVPIGTFISVVSVLTSTLCFVRAVQVRNLNR